MARERGDPFLPADGGAVPVRDEPLAPHTSLRVGGPARYYLASDDPGGLARVLATASDAGLPILILGGGSNLLVADGGFDGLVLKYTAARYDVVDTTGGTAHVTATAGLAIANLARRLARNGLAGLEWASNVPGTIGGAAVNNAGAFGGCMANDLIDLELLEAGGAPRTLASSALEYAYRSSLLKRGTLGPVLVTTVRCRLRRDEPTATTARIRELQQRRTESQPRQSSAGSVFANPPSDFAGRLIETVGLKGARVGGAQISTQHANFIVNDGRATASDVYELVRVAQAQVWREHAIWLRPEIELIGRWQPEQRRALLEGPSKTSAA